MFSLSQILGDVSAAHHQAPDDWARSVTTVVRDAAIYHTARNGFYRAQCDAGDGRARQHGEPRGRPEVDGTEAAGVGREAPEVVLLQREARP